MNFLVFSPVPSHPQDAGHRRRIFNLSKHLHLLNHKVHFVYFTLEGLYRRQFIDMMAEWDSLTVIKKEKSFTMNGPGFYLADDWYQDNIGDIISTKCQELDIEVVLVNYIFQSKLLEYVPKHTLKIIDTHDRFSDRLQLLRKENIDRLWFFTDVDQESKALSRADLILAIQNNEADYFRRITDKDVKTVSHIESSKFISKSYNKLGEIGFIGSGNPVNEKSIARFIDQWISYSKKGSIDIELVFAGEICNFISADHRGIRKLGYVDDVSSFYKDVDLVINPVTFGTGLSIKTVEALAYGIPILSTRKGFDGIESCSEYHQCETLTELIHRIRILYDNPQKLNELSKTSRTVFHSYLEQITSIFEEDFLLRYFDKERIVTKLNEDKAELVKYMEAKTHHIVEKNRDLELLKFEQLFERKRSFLLIFLRSLFDRLKFLFNRFFC